MKRIVLSFIGALLILSCSENDAPKPFALEGKTYAAVAYRGGGWLDEDYYDVYWVYKFISETEVERTARRVVPTGGIIGDIDTFKYELNYPDLIIKLEYNDLVAKFIDQKTFRTGSGSDITEYTLQ